MNDFKSYIFRDYCACCANFRKVSRFISGEYFCASCKRKIASRLRKRGIDLTARSPDLEAMRHAVDEIVGNLQSTLPEGKKTQRRDYKKREDKETKWWKHRNGKGSSGEPPS